MEYFLFVFNYSIRIIFNSNSDAICVSTFPLPDKIIFYPTLNFRRKIFELPVLLYHFVMFMEFVRTPRSHTYQGIYNYVCLRIVYPLSYITLDVESIPYIYESVLNSCTFRWLYLWVSFWDNNSAFNVLDKGPPKIMNSATIEIKIYWPKIMF